MQVILEEETYTIDNTGPTVTASPPGGTFGPAGTSVTLSSETVLSYTTQLTELHLLHRVHNTQVQYRLQQLQPSRL